MAMLSFLPRFAPLVQDGTKRQTIRRRRKRPICEGDDLILATGARTKNYRRLSGPGKPVECPRAEEVLPIRIFRYTYACGCFGRERTAIRIMVAGKTLTHKQRLALALADGFNAITEFTNWFDRLYGLPFSGVVIRW